MRYDKKEVILSFYDDIDNQIYLMNEYLEQYAHIRKIEFYMKLLKSDDVESELKTRIKRQFNKEIVNMIMEDEEYDQWYKENILEAEDD